MRISDQYAPRSSDRWDIYRDYRQQQDENSKAPRLAQAAPGTQETPETKRPGEAPESARPELARECQTCKNRSYQDGSDDPGVSFKAPTRVDPKMAAAAVRGHEQEHVVREQSKAQREDRKIVAQSVTYHNAICPECGKVYVAGGTTRTTTKSSDREEQPQQAQEPAKSGGLDLYA